MKFTNLERAKPQRWTAAAFSLIEQLVGVSVVGVAVTSLYAAFSQGFAIIQVARENLRATQVLCEKVETIRLYTLDQITNANFNGGNFLPRTFTALFYPVGQTNIGVTYQGSVTITNPPIAANYSNDLYFITFEVRWNSDDVQRRRSMSTFVARDGLQNYIY